MSDERKQEITANIVAAVAIVLCLVVGAIISDLTWPSEKRIVGSDSHGTLPKDTIRDRLEQQIGPIAAELGISLADIQPFDGKLCFAGFGNQVVAEKGTYVVALPFEDEVPSRWNCVIDWPIPATEGKAQNAYWESYPRVMLEGQSGDSLLKVTETKLRKDVGKMYVWNIKTVNRPLEYPKTQLEIISYTREPHLCTVTLSESRVSVYRQRSVYLIFDGSGWEQVALCSLKIRFLVIDRDVLKRH